MTLLLAQISGGSNNYVLNCSVGSYSLSGKDATLVVARKLNAVNGSYALSGQSATLKTNRSLVATKGDYLIAGQDAALKVSRTLVVDTGNYTITGQDAIFASSVVIPPKRLGVGYWVDPKKPTIIEEEVEEVEEFVEPLLDKLRATKESHNKIVERSELAEKQIKLRVRKSQDETIIRMYIDRKRKAQDEEIIEMYFKGRR